MSSVYVRLAIVHRFPISRGFSRNNSTVVSFQVHPRVHLRHLFRVAVEQLRPRGPEKGRQAGFGDLMLLKPSLTGCYKIKQINYLTANFWTRRLRPISAV